MNKMKLSLIVVAILGSLMAITPIARAADAAAEAKPESKVETQPAAKADAKVEAKSEVKTTVKTDAKTGIKAAVQTKRADSDQQIAKALKLTEEQKAKIKTIRADERTKLKELRGDKADRKELAKIRQETAAKIKDVLTAEQKEQYNKTQAKAHKRIEKAQKKDTI